MSIQTSRRSLTHALTLAALAAALQAGLRAQTPAGFAERYALAPDRAAVIADLIPGTADYYYYQCRERLDARDFESVRQILPTWIKRHGRTARVVEIENREALLGYGDHQERTFAFLRDRLGLRFSHERVVPGARSDLPTSLDPSLITPTNLTQRALQRHPGSVDGFHDAALARIAASADLDDKQLHSLLRRLRRPDVPNLPALLVRDLGRRESRGFGSLPVHNMLRRQQLDQCLELRAELLRSPQFVNAYLKRLQPDADLAWHQDTAARGEYLQRLWSFAQRLDPSFNSLKAHILYHQLQHDLSLGAPDKQRLLAYLRLPRRGGHVSRAHIERFQDRAQHVDPNGDFPTLMRPIGDDTQLVQTCLEHFFAQEDSIAAFSNYLDDRWLNRVFAETKILLGQGDMERWYSLLNDPNYLEQLEQRVELRFPASLQEHFAADDAVSITVETKNVPTLLVKVFAIDSYRYLVEKQRPVDASIELDGIVANHEQTYSFDEPPTRRVARTFDLPMLREPGTYVVEFVGNGISSRAVIHKGSLRMVERTSAAGHLVRVYDEAGRAVSDATVWFGGQEYTPDERGEVLVPFSTRPGLKQLVLHHGNRASLAPFTHRAESYQLHGGVFVDRESLVAGATARLAMRPQLQLAGHDVSLQLLQEPMLVIVATDLDGLTTTQEVRDLELTDGHELVHELRVPRRLRTLAVTLRARVEGLDGKPVALHTQTATFDCNGLDATAFTAAPLLLRTRGGYAVELRGKSGELLGGRTCNFVLHHRDYVEPIKVALQTDAEGRIKLGRLDGITHVHVQENAGSGDSFSLRDRACRLPQVLHGRTGQTLRVPYQGELETPTRLAFSLLGQNLDAFEHLAIADGCVELRDLPPGDYSLQLHETGAEVTVRITRGGADLGFLVGRDRVLEQSRTQPLLLGDVTVDDTVVRIPVTNATDSTRVHVVATRYLPGNNPFYGLYGATDEAPTIREVERPGSSYHAGRKLGDEYRYVLDRRFARKYPGNMLERPSLLLNPMALAEDSWNSAVGLGGGAGGRFGGKRRGRGAPSRSQPSTGGPAEPRSAGTSPNLDFLPTGSKLLCNLQPDDDGIVTVPLAQLGAGQHVHVVAIDHEQCIYESTLRPEQQLTPRSRALPAALDVSQHFVETREIEFLAAGDEVTIDDTQDAEVVLHDSLAKVFELFTTISGNAELQQFAFVLEWPELSRDRKLELYSRHACHELHFFLHQKDPEFFAEVVRPFLANKLDKTFLDEWLLERDLRRYLQPWQFAQLNVIEKILLAQRLGADERAAVARSLRESLELTPVSPQQLAQLFTMSLNSQQLHAEGNGRLLAARLRHPAPAEDAPAMRDGAAADRAAGPGGGAQAGRPSGPTTNGPAGPAAKSGAPAGPPRAEMERLAKELQDSRDKKPELAEKHNSDAEGEAEVGADADDFYLGSTRREMAKRKNVRRLYRDVEKTKLLVEHNYHDRRELQPTTNVVPANRFWVDYAGREAGQPFVSPAVAHATGSFLEMMMALSVLDLPFEAGEHEFARQQDRTIVKATTPLLLVRKSVAPSQPAADAPPLLIGENFFRLGDRYRWVDGERRDAFVTDEFVAGIAYGCQVVVTNPTSSPRTADVLLQIPAGAVPLQSGFWTRGQAIQLQPYATQTLEYSFYFPATGTFAHFPAHASNDGELLAAADAQTLDVVDKPSRIDTSSWEHVSQQGSPQEVLSFLDQHNLKRIDLTRIAWRMRDRAFFQQVTDKLEKRHVYDHTLWSYGVLHRDPEATEQYVRHRQDFLNRCGAWLDSPLVQIDPVELRRFDHLELNPLVQQRAHQLGSDRKFGNQDLAQQYAKLMDVLGYRPELDADDWLTVTYYFLLQDRVEDALQSFAKIEPARLEARIQYDYLSAYLCFFTGENDKARRIATAHEDHPVAHWQSRFATVLAQLDEAEGKVAAPTDAATPDSLAATAPALELAIDGRTVAVRYENLTACEVRYYELDVEFAFSAQPFADQDGTSAAFVQPNARETRSLPADQAQIAFELPADLRQKNVLIEVRAGGLVRSRQYFTNALDVRFLESYGQVAVRDANGERPLPKTYVKVFARLPDGTVRFHKDGYTDIRGRFDYASLSDDPNRGAERYAVLVLDERRGAVIREIAPPAR